MLECGLEFVRDMAERSAFEETTKEHGLEGYCLKIAPRCIVEINGVRVDAEQFFSQQNAQAAYAMSLELAKRLRYFAPQETLALLEEIRPLSLPS